MKYRVGIHFQILRVQPMRSIQQTTPFVASVGPVMRCPTSNDSPTKKKTATLPAIAKPGI
jgi:hypothetical protein